MRAQCVQKLGDGNFLIIDRLANRPFLLKFFNEDIQLVLLKWLVPFTTNRWGPNPESRRIPT